MQHRPGHWARLMRSDSKSQEIEAVCRRTIHIAVHTDRAITQRVFELLACRGHRIQALAMSVRAGEGMPPHVDAGNQGMTDDSTGQNELAIRTTEQHTAAARARAAWLIHGVPAIFGPQDCREALAQATNWQSFDIDPASQRIRMDVASWLVRCDAPPALTAFPLRDGYESCSVRIFAKGRENTSAEKPKSTLHGATSWRGAAQGQMMIQGNSQLPT
eukprot:1265517-Amphidinium_carterae.1